jgi:hypothetical protein
VRTVIERWNGCEHKIGHVEALPMEALFFALPFSPIQTFIPTTSTDPFATVALLGIAQPSRAADARRRVFDLLRSRCNGLTSQQIQADDAPVLHLDLLKA